MANPKTTEYGMENIVIIDHTSTGTSGVLRIGTSASRYALGTTANREGVRFNFASTATTGTNRGLDTRLTLSSGAGGEAGRFFTLVESNTPADTVNGCHTSVNFGSSTGNITGLGTAERHTFHCPSRSLGGTWSAAMCELYADGTASTGAGGRGSMIRAVIDGNATGKALLEDNTYLLDIDTGTNASGNVVSAVGNEPTWASKTHKIRIIANGTAMSLVAVIE